MEQHQTQRTLGLLQLYFSQQETNPVPAIGSPSILPDKVTPRPSTRPGGSDIFGPMQYRAIPDSLDLTTYQPIVTKPFPLSDQTSPTVAYPMLDQIEPIVHDIDSDQVLPLDRHTKRTRLLRIAAIITILILPIAFYLIWHPITSVSSSPLITQQNLSGIAPKVSSSKSSVTTNTTANTGGDIQVYILGAVLHPGVYTLPANARVYQLLQAAGGPSSKADLVVLNLAAKLSDGQEIYVTSVGESPPTTNSSLSGIPSNSNSTSSSVNQPLVNVNTASADEMRQQLSVSIKTAQAIVTYRQQHGPYTSVDQLLQVVSKSIYDKVKDKVTV